MDKTKFISNLDELIQKSCEIENELFEKNNVKRGLRNQDHTGVLVGLTNIGDVVGYEKKDDALNPIPGKLIYRGIDVEEISENCLNENRHGFDETIYLLLTGKLPNKSELEFFTEYLSSLRELPAPFVNNMITLRGENIMNVLARSVLILYTYDQNPEDLSLRNLVEQSLSLIAKFPTIIAYAYHSRRHAYHRKTLSIRHPQLEMSTAENFLYMLKGPDKYTKLEADLLDLSLVLHAEHGGGNNSTFTMRVTRSSRTDTYSAVSSAIASLKGPLHGGANLKVLDMMENIKENVKDWASEKEMKEYLTRMLKKEVYDKSGTIYGIGHAMYTLSDPLALLLKQHAKALAIEKDKYEEFHLYELLEELAPIAFSEFKGSSSNKLVCANVDLYSGFVYSCIGIKKELYTPLFAMSRIAGWCAHRIEELTFSSRRIIRPAYKNVYSRQPYISLDDRD